MVPIKNYILFTNNAFLHTYCTSNAGNFLVFCLRKNTKLQNETSISTTLAVNNIGSLEHLIFGLVPVYVSVKILYFHQILEQKNTKQKSYAKSFKIV